MSNELRIIMDSLFYIFLSIFVAICINIFICAFSTKKVNKKKEINKQTLQELLSYLVKEGYTFKIKKLEITADEIEFLTIELKKLQEDNNERIN